MSNKGLKFHPQALSTAEVEALMAACSATSPTGKRNRALIVVLWRGALRCNEALSLRPYDLDHETNSLRVMFGKGAQPRTIGIGPRSWAVIDVWLEARRELFAAVRAEGRHIPQDAPVFCVVSRPWTGKKLNARQVRQFMHDYGEDAGISKRTAPHQLRHSRATEMARERKGTQAIQAALGHSNLATTDRYIRQLFPEEVIKTMIDSEWDRAYGPADEFGDGISPGEGTATIQKRQVRGGNDG